MERIMDAPYNLTTGLPEQVSFRALNVGRSAGGLFARIGAWFAEQRRIDEITRTLNRRTDRQLADMGLTRDDIRNVARGLPLATPRQEFDASARPTVRPVSLMPLALMR
jgi:uncharacterized protein YjiS (DUF1127 family)